MALTAIPTAAGRERRVVEWVNDWVAARPGLEIRRDDAGNLTIDRPARRGGEDGNGEAPIYFTAHLDHPAFVIDQIVGPGTLSASFRGGVMAPYFRDARVLAHGESGEIRGRITESETGDPFRRCVIELEGDSEQVAIGDIATWDLPEPRIEDGRLHTNACDDLAAVAAALAALDLLRRADSARDVRILLTVAEEVGFVGAIAACKLKTMPAGARVIALENSRSFADSPIGAGPIVRVGDRLTTFDPSLTMSIARLAEELGGVPERKVGDPTPAKAPAFKWQRKLMAGGACEASAFSAWGYEATCLCLPLGNYHNMTELDRVQREAREGPEDQIRAAVGPEHIAIADFEGLVDLLIACGESLRDMAPMIDRLEKLYSERRFVLDQ